MRYIKLRHEVLHARYDEPTGKWHMRIRRPVPGTTPEQFEEFEDVADFVLAGIGTLSRWKWPEIAGLNDFKGTLFHSAGFEVDGSETWQEAVEEWKEKKVGVIGVVPIASILRYERF